MDKLKPCPFCGHTPKLHRDRWPIDDEGHMARAFWVKCGKCGSSSNEYNTPAQAEDAWNRRTDNGT